MSKEIIVRINEFEIMLISFNNKKNEPKINVQIMKEEEYEYIESYDKSKMNLIERKNLGILKVKYNTMKNLYYTYYNSDHNKSKLLIGIIRNIINVILAKELGRRFWGILLTIIINIIKMNFID